MSLADLMRGQRAGENPFYNSHYGGLLTGSLPTAYSGSGAPTYDLNTTYGQQSLATTLGAGGAGRMDTGVSAFLGPAYQGNYMLGNRNGASATPNVGAATMDQSVYDLANNFNAQPLQRLGVQTGYGSPIDILGRNGQVGNSMQYQGENWAGDATNPIYSRGAITDNDKQARWDDLTRLQSGLEDYTKDYSYISGMSSGWDGRNAGARSAAGTLYHNVNNVLTPVGQTNYYNAPEKKGGWVRNDGAELIAGLSMMLPAFGGLAGLGFGTAAGAPSTLTSAGGIFGSGGLSAGAAAGFNGLAGAALSGSSTGALGALGGGLGGWGGQVLGNSLGNYGQLGGQLGSMFGRALATGQAPGVGQLFSAGRNIMGSGALSNLFGGGA